MLRLFQTPPAWDLPNFSQASMKLETWLRLAGIAYEKPALDLGLSPKGKVPFIIDQGTVLGDSTLIIEHLKKSYGVDPDARLTSPERAVSLAFRRMIKENLFWATHYSRYFDEGNWPTYRALLASILTPGQTEEAREPVLAGFRDYQKTQLMGHGMGRHQPAEIYEIGMADLAALADFLEDKPFFFGAEPSTLDATADAYLANILYVPIDSPLKQYGRTRRNLHDFCQRMRSRFYPEMACTSA
jgi:glutathione S-transferase